MKSAPGVQRGNVQAAVGVAVLKRDPFGFVKRVGIENHGTASVVRDSDGPCIALGKESAYIAGSLSLYIVKS